MKHFYVSLLVLFLFCIFISMLNTTSYAFTWEDYIDFCGNINNSLITDGDTKWIANRIKNYRTQIEQAIVNAGLNVNDYNNFYCYKQRSSSDNFLLMWNSNYNVQIQYGVSVGGLQADTYINGANGLKLINIYDFTISNASNVLYGQNKVVGLIDADTSTPSVEHYYLSNQYIYSNILSTNLEGQSPYYFADGRVGINLWRDSYTWYIVQNDNFIPLQTITEDIYGAKLSGLLLTREMLEQLNSFDDCYLYYGDITTKRYQSETFILNYQLDPEETPSGTITNQSGDVTGSIDLSGIENGLNNINSSLNSGNLLIEEQTEVIKDNQSFWESTYNELFSMDSGDVNELYLMVQSYFPSGDTPLTVYDTIFGAYGNDPDDFIIRWDDIPLNITWFGGQELYSGDFIKAGYMNFSKECRDNEVLSNIKFWINTLFTIFILLGYYKFLYNSLCIMLGVISQDIPEEEPEHRPIGFRTGGK